MSHYPHNTIPLNSNHTLQNRALLYYLQHHLTHTVLQYTHPIQLVAYLHHETETLERSEIIRDLRLGKYDVLVGINLLREGLDLPEVSLIAVLDADKEGFLRSSRSLIQTVGRAARNEHGRVIFYADSMTESMQKAINETKRRREIQEAYNKENNIIPKTIIKEIRESVHGKESKEETKIAIARIFGLGKSTKEKPGPLLEHSRNLYDTLTKELDGQDVSDLEL